MTLNLTFDDRKYGRKTVELRNVRYWSFYPEGAASTLRVEYLSGSVEYPDPAGLVNLSSADGT